MKDLKYLFAYLLPISVFLALYSRGWLTYSGFIVGFILLPAIELFLKGNKNNHEPHEEEKRSNQSFFNILLYLNVPILYGLLGYFFYQIAEKNLLPYEIIGMTISVGIACGTVGINVGHELGHRQHWFDKLCAKMLLLPSFYMHFTIEHNLGHHKHVSTDLDPASARLNETIYAFYIRSVIGCYRNAWKLEAKRLHQLGKNALHPTNAMIHFTLIELLYIITVYTFFGTQALFGAIGAGTLGFLLLETVNYIEHYGLRRKLLPSGRYEVVAPRHSWNSNHELGRIFLYELTRHSDHHYKASRKYQILRHFDESPQLPLGYPGAMMLAMFPPLWFKTINPLVQLAMEQHKNQQQPKHPSRASVS